MNTYCENCGGLLDENGNCPYCGKTAAVQENVPFQESSQGISIEDLTNTQYQPVYEEVECREAHLNFWNTIFPMFFAFGFGFVGIIIPIFLKIQNEPDVPYMMFIPFAIIGIVATLIVIYGFHKAFAVALFGREIGGVVKGYRMDTMMYNGMPGAVAEILVTTNSGKKLLLYQIGGPAKPFAVGSTVRVKVYKDYYKVIQEKNKIWDEINN